MGEQMLRDIEVAKEKEAAAAEARKAEAKERMLAVQQANAAMQREKVRQAELERMEDMRIAQYVAEQDAKKEAEEEMARLRAEEKERETARLRAMQEKANDRQAEEDAKKARRAQEAYDRECRMADLAAAEAAARKKVELKAALNHQMQEKRSHLELAAREERREFEHILRTQQEAETLEHARRVTQAEARLTNANEVKNQIVHNTTMRSNERQAFLDEGENMRQQMEVQAKKSNFIKQAKLKEL